MDFNVQDIDIYGQTDLGLERQHNEDAFFIAKDKLICAVADGLGGLPHGEIASSIAVEAFRSLALKEDGVPNFHSLFQLINQKVCQAGQKVDTQIGIATTLTAVKIVNANLYIGHIGDTGVYLVRAGLIKKLTQDHTLAQNILNTLKQGEAIPKIPSYFYNTLTKCIGHPSELEVDCFSIALQKNDKILLYSDGVTKVLDEQEILAILDSCTGAEETVCNIINLANKRGGPDNITAVVIIIK